MKKTKCDMVTEVTCSHDMREQCRRFWKDDIIITCGMRIGLMTNT